MGVWLRPGKHRAIKRIVTSAVVGCSFFILLNAVWKDADLDDQYPPKIERFQVPLRLNKEKAIKSSNNSSSSLVLDAYQSMIDKRLKLHQKSCQNKWSDKFGDNKLSIVFHDDDIKLGYCFIAKIGCTFWLRMLSFLTRSDEMKQLGIRTPFDIDRSLLHTGKLGPAKWQFLHDFHKVAKSTTRKFLFTRNPYERLWSVYLDKYYLIDYWVTNPIARTECGKHVSFQRFLEWAVNSTDHHLVPVNTACQPCSFKPDFIGKMETFTQDSKFLLESSGYSHLLKDYNHSLYVDTELQSLIVYNFKAMRYPVFASGKCLTTKQLCQRMWHVFQMNGLMREDIPFQEISDYSEKSAIKMFLDVVHTSPITKEDSRKQRRKAITNAYSGIKWKTIRAIQERYQQDFDMFDYDLYPPSQSI